MAEPFHSWLARRGMAVTRMDHVLGHYQLLPAETDELLAAWQEHDRMTVTCSTGRKHWGPWGAAGLLPVTRFLGFTFVLLQLRPASGAVQEGGCWSTIGGALEGPNEAPEAAAWREFYEEVEVLSSSRVISSLGEWVSNCQCGWPYTMVLADFTMVGTPPLVRARSSRAWETDELRWVAVAEVDSYELHPGFKDAWPDVQKLIKMAEQNQELEWRGETWEL